MQRNALYLKKKTNFIIYANRKGHVKRYTVSHTDSTNGSAFIRVSYHNKSNSNLQNQKSNSKSVFKSSIIYFALQFVEES